MKYKAVLIGALVRPYGKGDPGPWGVLENSYEECVKQAKAVLGKIKPEERKTAYVRIIEVKEIGIAEVHTAAEKGPDGELRFAIAEV